MKRRDFTAGAAAAAVSLPSAAKATLRLEHGSNYVVEFDHLPRVETASGSVNFRTLEMPEPIYLHASLSRTFPRLSTSVVHRIIRDLEDEQSVVLGDVLAEPRTRTIVTHLTATDVDDRSLRSIKEVIFLHDLTAFSIRGLRPANPVRPVPVVAKLPYIGRLFRTPVSYRATESLTIQVTPRIIIDEE